MSKSALMAPTNGLKGNVGDGASSTPVANGVAGFLSRHEIGAWGLVGLVLLALLGAIDYLTGPDVSLSLFYLVPISIVTWRANRTAGLIISVASAVTWFIADMLLGMNRSGLFVGFWNGAIRLGFFVIVTMLLSTVKASRADLEDKVKARTAELTDEIAERKKIEASLERSREELRALSARLQSVREEESTRIAREVHDQVGQALTSLNVDLMWVQNRLRRKSEENSRDQIEERLNLMVDLLEETGETVQRIAEELRPGLLDDLGLLAAIEWQTEQFQNRTGIHCDLKCETAQIQLDQSRSTALFRIFQEILTNVARHSAADHLYVSMQQAQGAVVMEVRDNGKGISEDQVANLKSLGLLGMRERAIAAGGEVTFHGEAGKGTTVRVRVPFSQTHQPTGNSEWKS